MSISKDDLLADPLLPSINEEPKPALTLSELFNTERIVLGVIKSKVSGIIEQVELTKDEPNHQHVNKLLDLSPKIPAPKFDFEDQFKNTLANNAWQQMEYRLASGGAMYSKEDISNNIGFMLQLNMAIYDKIPHQNFIGFQPMDNPCQLVYHNTVQSVKCGVEKLEVVEARNSVENYAIEAKTRRLTTSIANEAMLDMTSMNRLDIEDEILEVVSHNISGEMYREMVSKIDGAASTSTVAAAPDTPPSSLDIMAAIHEASDEITKHASTNRRANWIIMSPQMAAILLTDKNGIDTSSRKEAPHASLIGSMHGMDVYMDTEGAIKANDILVGHKGNHAFNQGMAYCPHTLAMDSGDVINPMTFNTSKSFVTRHDYFVPNDADHYFHKIEFKEASEEYLVGYKAGHEEMDAGYFYCPYIPLLVTETDEDLMDIILPFGAPEKKTIAELFS